ncbi:hypothetical protein ABH924_003264 [Arthrobacter sp. GAS37]
MLCLLTLPPGPLQRGHWRLRPLLRSSVRPVSWPGMSLRRGFRSARWRASCCSRTLFSAVRESFARWAAVTLAGSCPATGILAGSVARRVLAHSSVTRRASSSWSAKVSRSNPGSRWAAAVRRSASENARLRGSRRGRGSRGLRRVSRRRWFAGYRVGKGQDRANIEGYGIISTPVDSEVDLGAVPIGGNDMQPGEFRATPRLQSPTTPATVNCAATPVDYFSIGADGTLLLRQQWQPFNPATEAPGLRPATVHRTRGPADSNPSPRRNGRDVDPPGGINCSDPLVWPRDPVGREVPPDGGPGGTFQG